MSLPEIIAFSIYLIAMFAIGLFFYHFTRNLSDYILGGRRLGSVVAALSACASDMSGWLLLGLPGAVYAYGINQSWIAIGLSIGAYINWQFVASRLRNYTEIAGDSITIPDYLENRFRDKSKILRIASASVILVFFTFYTSSGLVSGAVLFEKTFGLDYTSALLSGCFIIVMYTFLGGFLAVSWTDFFQGSLMLAALILVPLFVFKELGGWGNTVSIISQMDTNYLNIYTDMSVISVISLMSWGLGYFGQPHILSRFMAVKSIREIPKARFIGMSWMVVSLYGAIFTGFSGLAYFSENTLSNPETVFIALTHTIFNPWISGFLIAAILAAIMSTVDSQLLVCSSVIVQDFYKVLFRKNASQKELVWMGRSCVVVIALCALCIASDPQSRILDLVAYAWAGFGASFGPVVIFSLFWKRMTQKGALGGIFAGALTVIIWKQMKGTIFDIYEILPGVILCSIGIIIISLADNPPEDEITSEFSLVTHYQDI